MRPAWRRATSSPDLVEQRIGDLVLSEVGEGSALDQLEGQQTVVVRRLAHGHHRGDGSPGAGRQVGGQGLVTHLRARADIGELVLDPLDPQHPPSPVEQVGVPLVAPDEGHMDGRPSRPAAHEHGATGGGQRLQRVDVQAGPGQGVDQARRIEASGRRPEGGEHGGAHDHADEHGDQDTDRHGGRRDHPQGGHQPDPEPQRAPPTAVEQGRHRDHHRGHRREVGGRRERPAGDPRVRPLARPPPGRGPPGRASR